MRPLLLALLGTLSLGAADHYVSIQGNDTWTGLLAEPNAARTDGPFRSLPKARAAARAELAELGFASTLDYLAHCARLVFEQTGLLPHLNPGVMTATDLAKLRPVSASMGIMLESAAERLCAKGGPHHRSPDKHPTVRLATLRAAGEMAVPFTTGLLIGIGETRRERIETLLAIRDLHERYGHIQEIIVQNFRAKPGTRMADSVEPSLEELQWTIAMARLIFGANMSIQAPPNLSAGSLTALVQAGVNDWGGVSPVSPDFINPERPWPDLDVLRERLRGDRSRERTGPVEGIVEGLTRPIVPLGDDRERERQVPDRRRAEAHDGRRDRGNRLLARPVGERAQHLSLSPAGCRLTHGAQLRRAHGLRLHRLRLDLPNALTRDVKLLTHLFERVISVHVDAKSHTQNLGFSSG